MNILLRPFRSGLRRAWRWLGVAEHQLVLAWRVLLRTLRLVLRPVLGLRKQVLVLDNPPGYSAGLFAEFGAVLGMLEHYEAWQRQYAGATVEFSGRGMYHDPAAGENWWEYYFEPIRIGSGPAIAAARRVDTFEHIGFSVRATRGLRRADGHRLIESHVRVRPEIGRKVDAFAREHFANAATIGVHYRGTDKSAEAPRVPYETVLHAIRARLAIAGQEKCRLFVATDEADFLEFMRAQFPDKLIYSGSFRSSNGMPAHAGNPDMFKRGEEAVVDCLLLSRCTHLIRTPSNLGLCATFFNPSLPVTLLSSQ